MHEHPGRVAAAPLPVALNDFFGGNYYLGLKTGSMDLTVTKVKGRNFSGKIECVGDDGSDVHMVYTATLPKHGRMRITVKSIKGKQTNFAGTGSYTASDGSSSAGMTVLVMSGKFEGYKIPRFVPGEFALMQNLDTIYSRWG